MNLRNILINWAISSLILYGVTFIFSGLYANSIFAAVSAAGVLSFINATIKPILQIISIPITLLTLGFFYLVVNALILMFVSAVVPGFVVYGFWTAFFASIMLSFLNTLFLGKVRIQRF